MKTKIEEINEAALAEMAAHDIEDTTENRAVFLQGLYDAWMEDEERCIEKALYQVALIGEINRLKIKLMFQNINS